MKLFFNLFMLIFIIASVQTCKVDEKNPDCTDRYRWDIKTLTDPNAPNVNYTTIYTTISTLISTTAPIVSSNGTRSGIEFKTYSIKVHIREYKLSADGDYHLVLEDIADPNKTMIGEIPDPYCGSVQSSIRINEITQARKNFQNSLLVTAQVDNSVYTITGVAFYDKVHGQIGVAPNGIEIHPILYITRH